MRYLVVGLVFNLGFPRHNHNNNKVINNNRVKVPLLFFWRTLVFSSFFLGDAVNPSIHQSIK